MVYIVLCIVLILAFLFFIYYLMITPRVLGRPDESIFSQKFFAHRGLHDNQSVAPENSMAAFKRAVEAGYGIELDVQLSKDRIPIVFHDEDLERVCGQKGKVRDYTFEELQKFPLCNSDERIPKFQDVLQLINGRVPLIIEIKIHEDYKKVCKLADQVLKLYQGAYCMESFHTGALFWYRMHRKGVIRGQLSSDFYKEIHRLDIPSFMVHHLLLNFVGKPDFVAYNHLYKKVREREICFHFFKIKAAAWTIKSSQELKEAKNDFDVFIFEGFLPEQET